MTRLRIPAPTPATLIASLALFLALSGTVYAGVRIAKNSVGSSEVKNKSIKGGDLADDTLTGAQIDESTLAAVPRAAAAGTAGSATSAAMAGSAKTADRATSAASADRAGYADRAATADKATTAGSAATATSATSALTSANADKAALADEASHAATSDRVGGHPASDFASAATTFAVAVKLAAGGKATLVTRDGLSIEARCTTDATPSSGTTPVTALELYAASTTAGATLQSRDADFDGSSAANLLGPSTAEIKREAYTLSVSAGSKREEVPDDGIVFTSAGGTTIFFGSAGGMRASVGLNGAACTISAPVVIAAP